MLIGKRPGFRGEESREDLGSLELNKFIWSGARSVFYARECIRSRDSSLQANLHTGEEDRMAIQARCRSAS